MRALIRNVVLPVHRWTALTLGLVVLWMALTGLGLLFKAQLDPAVNRSLETVAACQAPQPVDELVARARTAHPRGALRLVGIEGSATRSTWVRFANGDTVYLDPCSGRVVGELNKYRGIFGALEYLHRLEFLSGADHAVAGTVALVFALSSSSAALPSGGQSLSRGCAGRSRLRRDPPGARGSCASIGRRASGCA